MKNILIPSLLVVSVVGAVTAGVYDIVIPKKEKPVISAQEKKLGTLISEFKAPVPISVEEKLLAEEIALRYSTAEWNLTNGDLTAQNYDNAIFQIDNLIKLGSREAHDEVLDLASLALDVDLISYASNTARKVLNNYQHEFPFPKTLEPKVLEISKKLIANRHSTAASSLLEKLSIGSQVIGADEMLRNGLYHSAKKLEERFGSWADYGEQTICTDKVLFDQELRENIVYGLLKKKEYDLACFFASRTLNPRIVYDAASAILKDGKATDAFPLIDQLYLDFIDNNLKEVEQKYFVMALNDLYGAGQAVNAQKFETGHLINHENLTDLRIYFKDEPRIKEAKRRIKMGQPDIAIGCCKLMSYADSMNQVVDELVSHKQYENAIELVYMMPEEYQERIEEINELKN